MTTDARAWIGDIDLYLAGEGRHEELYRKLGAHVLADGVSFAVWAPNADAVSVVGDWNSWDGGADRLEPVGSPGGWDGLVAAAGPGHRYKFELPARDGRVLQKAAPYASAAEEPPLTASVVYRSEHEWNDRAWLDRRRETEAYAGPMSVYEVHLGSWRRNPL